MLGIRKKHISHDKIMDQLERKKRIAERKCDERKLKLEILKLYFPFRFKIKFSKLIVIISIAAIILYTIAAILLQKYSVMEISPTLTTCVFSFFGVELLSLAGIKRSDTKFEKGEVSRVGERVIEEDPDAVG